MCTCGIRMGLVKTHQIKSDTEQCRSVTLFLCLSPIWIQKNVDATKVHRASWFPQQDAKTLL